MTRGAIAYAVLVILVVSRTAAAEVSLQKLTWELGRRAPVTKPAAAKFERIETLKLESGRIGGKLHARLTLVNRGPKALEGILLRYSLTARLVPLAEKKEGVWVVAFLLDERHVPKIGANQVQDVLLDPSVLLDLYLKKAQRGGYVPDRIRLDLMIEPHPGDNLPIQSLQSELGIDP